MGYRVAMSENEQSKAQQITRLSYWTREEDYTPPKKIVKRPSDVTVDDLLAFDLQAYVEHYTSNNGHRNN